MWDALTRVFGRKYAKRVEQDKELLCWRDSETGVLFTWDCNPGHNLKVWIPKDPVPHEFDIWPLMLAMFKKSDIDAQVAVTAWACVTASFSAYVKFNLEESKTPGGMPSVDDVITVMENEFKEKP